MARMERMKRRGGDACRIFVITKLQQAWHDWEDGGTTLLDRPYNQHAAIAAFLEQHQKRGREALA
jgi:hypothetical protein